MPNSEHQEQTKTNYNAKYWAAATNKIQLWYYNIKYWTIETNKNKLLYQIFKNKNKRKPTIIPNIEQQQNKQNPTIIPNIEQQQQTKSNYNTNYGTIGTNKNQL